MFKLEALLQMSKDRLVNEVYNRQIADLADDEEAKHSKAIPYIGWFWRDVDVVGKDITIGDCGDFIGVMENNKWGYPQRRMTPEECERFVGFIDQAIEENRKGGQLSETRKRMSLVLRELWVWMQSLTVEV